jgi:hypothetical protein
MADPESHNPPAGRRLRPPAADPSTVATVLCLFALAVAFGVKVFAAFHEYPESYVDEVIYMEPAWQAVTTGHFANPGIAQQLAQKGVPGLDHSCYLNLPGALWIKTPLLWIAGTGVRGLRIVDLIITVAAAAAFAFVVSRLAHGWRRWLAVCVFVLNPIFLWALPGRPDILSLLFGLTALALVLPSPDTARSHGAGVLVAAGALLGWCAACHLFGGVYWGVTVAALLVAADPKPRQILHTGCLLAAGWALALAPNLAWMIHGGADAWRQFHWLLQLKQTLVHSFTGTLANVLVQSVGRNPLVLLVPFLLPWAVRGPTRRLVFAWAFAIAVLLVWRCAQFEGYNHAYEVHLWASVCCLFAITLEALDQSTRGITPRSGRGQPPSAVFALAFLITGLITGHNKWTEALFLNYARRHRAIQETVSRTVPANARVLISSDAYFISDLPGAVLMAHHDRLDLDSFDFIVTRIPLGSKTNRDQWIDVLTPEQDLAFRRDFHVAASLPVETAIPVLRAGTYQPNVPGLFIYSRSAPQTPARN